MKIKICGITREEDYLSAARLGADFVGFVFYPPSCRFVSPAWAAGIGTDWPSEKPLRVGVFVNASAQFINRTIRSAHLNLVQLHGEESPEFNRSIECPCWKALRVSGPTDIPDMEAYRHWPGLLAEPLTAGVYGGAGKVFTLDLAGELVHHFPEIILAGGVSETNLQDWLSLSVATVDLSGSIEDAPGIKSEEKMNRFFKRYRDLHAPKKSMEVEMRNR